METQKSVMGRAFLLLDCFRGGDPSLSLATLVERSGLPKSTAHRVATSLTELGVLERVDGNYRLGLRIFELGSLVPRWRALREVALPYMQSLFEATHAVVHLGVLDATDVVYIEKIWGHGAQLPLSRTGGRMPAHCTGLGKALLAYSSPEVQAVALDRPMTRKTSYTIADASVLREELRKIASSGLAYDWEESALSLQCVASPVVNHRGHAVAALSLSVPTSRGDLDGLGSAVKTAAMNLSKAMPAALRV